MDSFNVMYGATIDRYISGLGSYMKPVQINDKEWMICGYVYGMVCATKSPYYEIPPMIINMLNIRVFNKKRAYPVTVKIPKCNDLYEIPVNKFCGIRLANETCYACGKPVPYGQIKWDTGIGQVCDDCNTGSYTKCYSITEFNAFDWVEFMSDKNDKLYFNCNPNSKYYGSVGMLFSESGVDFRIICDVEKLCQHIQDWLIFTDKSDTDVDSIDKYLNDENILSEETKYLEVYGFSKITPKFVLNNKDTLKKGAVPYETLERESRDRVSALGKWSGYLTVENDMKITLTEPLIVSGLVKQVQDTLNNLAMSLLPTCNSFTEYIKCITKN